MSHKSALVIATSVIEIANFTSYFYGKDNKRGTTGKIEGFGARVHSLRNIV
ncbi:MAG: hypothetical protein IPN13_14485 [Bacteroidetes bacterium]|nr:hypothetical protein [Bacteroidota bacterium]